MVWDHYRCSCCAVGVMAKVDARQPSQRLHKQDIVYHIIVGFQTELMNKRATNESTEPPPLSHTAAALLDGILQLTDSRSYPRNWTWRKCVLCLAENQFCSVATSNTTTTSPDKLTSADNVANALPLQNQNTRETQALPASVAKPVQSVLEDQIYACNQLVRLRNT